MTSAPARCPTCGKDLDFEQLLGCLVSYWPAWPFFDPRPAQCGACGSLCKFRLPYLTIIAYLLSWFAALGGLIVAVVRAMPDGIRARLGGLPPYGLATLCFVAVAVAAFATSYAVGRAVIALWPLCPCRLDEVSARRIRRPARPRASRPSR